MWRLIFIGFIIWLTFSTLKRVLRQNHSKNETTDAAKNSATHAAEDMVQCSHCAVHLPRSEAFLVNGRMYCSKDHIQSS